MDSRAFRLTAREAEAIYGLLDRGWDGCVELIGKKREGGNIVEVTFVGEISAVNAFVTEIRAQGIR